MWGANSVAENVLCWKFVDCGIGASGGSDEGCGGQKPAKQLRR
jgi:hypothetical protein